MKGYYSVPKFTKQLFWNLKVSQEQDGQGFLATDGLMGVKPVEGLQKPEKVQMNREYQQYLQIQKAKRLKKYVADQ